VADKSCELVERLRAVPDPRRQCANLKHRLEDVLILGFRGTLAGRDDFFEIADWAELHEDFFRSFLELPNGIPSHDTLNRVFAAVHTDALQAVLVPWLQRRRGDSGEFVPIDGKTMRRTRDPSGGLGALHVVSAWASESGLTLGQVAVEDKSNEITAIPKLLELLDLREKVVTIDAMGCQKEIAAKIVEGGGLRVGGEGQPAHPARGGEGGVRRYDPEAVADVPHRGQRARPGGDAGGAGAAGGAFLDADGPVGGADDAGDGDAGVEVPLDGGDDGGGAVLHQQPQTRPTSAEPGDPVALVDSCACTGSWTWCSARTRGGCTTGRRPRTWRS